MDKLSDHSNVSAFFGDEGLSDTDIKNLLTATSLNMMASTSYFTEMYYWIQNQPFIRNLVTSNLNTFLKLIHYLREGQTVDLAFLKKLTIPAMEDCVLAVFCPRDVALAAGLLALYSLSPSCIEHLFANNRSLRDKLDEIPELRDCLLNMSSCHLSPLLNKFEHSIVPLLEADGFFQPCANLLKKLLCEKVIATICEPCSRVSFSFIIDCLGGSSLMSEEKLCSILQTLIEKETLGDFRINLVDGCLEKLELKDPLQSALKDINDAALNIRSHRFTYNLLEKEVILE